MMNKEKMGLTAGYGSASKSPSGTKDSTGNGVQTFGDTELMERHQHGPDPVGAGVVIKTDD
jgi:hypothetical protein